MSRKLLTGVKFAIVLFVAVELAAFAEWGYNEGYI
jgi:hypothetical protein